MPAPKNLHMSEKQLFGGLVLPNFKKRTKSVTVVNIGEIPDCESFNVIPLKFLSNFTYWFFFLRRT